MAFIISQQLKHSQINSQNKIAFLTYLIIILEINFWTNKRHLQIIMQPAAHEITTNNQCRSHAHIKHYCSYIERL
jgi:hypothetical protein